jgi:hypothetical protein
MNRPVQQHSHRSSRLSIRSYALRSALVIFTVVVAAAIPFFGTVLGRVGGLTDATLAFVIPALIKLVDNNSSGYRLNVLQKGFYFVVGIWGVCLVLHTVNGLFGSLIFSDSVTNVGANYGSAAAVNSVKQN